LIPSPASVTTSASFFTPRTSTFTAGGVASRITPCQKVPTIANNLKNNARFLVAAHLRIHADPRLEVRAATAEIVNDFAVRVRAQTTRKFAVADLNVCPARSIQFQRAVILPHGHRASSDTAPVGSAA